MLAFKHFFVLSLHFVFHPLCICTLLSILQIGCSTDLLPKPSSSPWTVYYEAEAQNLTPKRKRYDLEEDGLPAQIPPPTRIHTLPDDPSQPWSINYGKETINDVSQRDDSSNENIADEEKIAVSPQ